MSKLIYIANIRLPTEKAHGYQIMQMCEAFALDGHEVTLVVPRRINPLGHIQNSWEYYGVEHNFKIVRLPSLDLIWLANLSRLAFLLQTFTFMVFLLLWLPFQHYEILFSRDQIVMVGLVALFPRSKLIYEIHHKARSWRAQRLQSWLLRRVGRVVSLTQTMADQLQATTSIQDLVVAHDGVRPERFANLPDQVEIRQALDIPHDAFVVCYAGRLHTMGMSKGLDIFVEAAAQVSGIYFLLVGGPAEQVNQLRDLWVQHKLPPENFCAVGSVPPEAIPRYLHAADVCIITSPQNEFFANETSPMKLFEYMMAGKAILASDLPSTREVVQHKQTAYLVPASDIQALASGLQILQDDLELRQQLGQQARQIVLNYTWQARAKRILS